MGTRMYFTNVLFINNFKKSRKDVLFQYMLGYVGKEIFTRSAAFPYFLLFYNYFKPLQDKLTNQICGTHP